MTQDKMRAEFEAWWGTWDSHQFCSDGAKEFAFAVWKAAQKREPLSMEKIWEIERNSYVASRQPEYTTDCFGEDKTVWHETNSFSFPLFARNIEAAHNITKEHP